MTNATRPTAWGIPKRLGQTGHFAHRCMTNQAAQPHQNPWLSGYRFISLTLAALLIGAPAVSLAQSSTGSSDTVATPTTSGPVRLRQSAPGIAERTTAATTGGNAGLGQIPGRTESTAAPLYRPGEFETYVKSIAGRQADEITQFGADLVAGMSTAAAAEFNPVVPADYAIQPGDELSILVWGSVDADLRLQVDRSGRIYVPRVGPIMVAGVRYADLVGVVTRRMATTFKNFEISVSLGQLRGIRVYITGFVQKPGPQIVSSLSTVSQAVLRAGGPSAAGSFRNVQLRRGGNAAGDFDLYDLLVRGDRTGDRLLQSDDVVHVGPIGPQVALIGSVNRPAVFELKPGETLSDLIAIGGGFAAVADTSRVALERMSDRPTVRVAQVSMADAKGTLLRSGDVVRAFNAIEVAQPVQRQNKRVRVEGEVVNPGEYVLPPGSTLNDAVAAAGGLTNGAFLYGTDFSRESVRQTQQSNYERVLRDLETAVSRNSASMRASSAEDVAAQNASSLNTSRLLERLRAIKPSGRVVLELPPQGGSLPALALEDGDRLYVPPVPTAIGVVGSVFNPGSYLYSSNRSMSDYLQLAGGATRGADESSAFVVRANGSVVGNQTSSGWFTSKGSLNGITSLPGDTLFIPEELNKTTFVQGAKDWTQIFYQLGLGIAGLKSALK